MATRYGKYMWRARRKKLKNYRRGVFNHFRRDYDTDPQWSKKRGRGGRKKWAYFHYYHKPGGGGFIALGIGKPKAPKYVKKASSLRSRGFKIVKKGALDYRRNRR